MSQAIGRKVRGAWLPTKTNCAAELSVPHPARVTRQARNRATVGQSNWRPFRLAINLLRKKAIRIVGNSREMLAGGLWPAGGRGPTLFKRIEKTPPGPRRRPKQVPRF